MNSIKKLPQTIIYAARINDRDVLRSSSSGGLFTVLSDPFLRCGGAIVCSVYQYDSHRIEFCLITEKSKRDCAKGSKYIQSSMGDIFRKAHEWLMEDAGRKLLFVGTGCQAEGFRKYAEQTGIRQRCTVVDIICHGAPSPLLWREYVTHLECIHKGKVTNLTFKDKRNGWLRPTACVKIFNKEISIADYVRNFLYRNIFRVHIGKNAVIYYGAEIRSPWNLHIGEGSVIGDRAILDARNGIYIGENVNLSSGVWIWTLQHNVNDPYFATNNEGKCVKIGDRAWLSCRSVILPGVTIGEGCVIAASAVAAKSTEAFSIYGGVPCKKIADRNPNLEYRFNGSHLHFL